MRLASIMDARGSRLHFETFACEWQRITRDRISFVSVSSAQIHESELFQEASAHGSHGTRAKYLLTPLPASLCPGQHQKSSGKILIYSVRFHFQHCGSSMTIRQHMMMECGEYQVENPQGYLTPWDLHIRYVWERNLSWSGF